MISDSGTVLHSSRFHCSEPGTGKETEKFEANSQSLHHEMPHFHKSHLNTQLTSFMVLHITFKSKDGKPSEKSSVV